MLNIETSGNAGKITITLQGRLDTVTAPDLEQALQKVIPEASELTLDFTNLAYISSAGLRVLLSAQKQMNKLGRMRLLHVSAPVLEIFEVTGFTDILTIE